MNTFLDSIRETVADAAQSVIAELKAEAARQRAERHAQEVGTPNPDPRGTGGLIDPVNPWPVAVNSDTPEYRVGYSNGYRAGFRAGQYGYGDAPEPEQSAADDGEAVRAGNLRIELEKHKAEMLEKITALAEKHRRDLTASEKAMLDRFKRHAEEQREYAKGIRERTEHELKAIGENIAQSERGIGEAARLMGSIEDAVKAETTNRERFTQGLANRITREGNTLRDKIAALESRAGKNAEALAVMREEFDAFADREAKDRQEYETRFEALERDSRILANSLNGVAQRLEARMSKIESGESGVTAVALIPDLDASIAQHEREHHPGAEQIAAKIVEMLADAGFEAEIHEHNTTPEEPER